MRIVKVKIIREYCRIREYTCLTLSLSQNNLGTIVCFRKTAISPENFENIVRKYTTTLGEYSKNSLTESILLPYILGYRVPET